MEEFSKVAFQNVTAANTEDAMKMNNKNPNEEDTKIPSWSDLQNIYERKWQTEKYKFQQQLKGNFRALIERFASGKQELFLLNAPERREKLYTNAFLELFESGYAPHIGDVEHIAGKRCRRLFVTLPYNYSTQ